MSDERPRFHEATFEKELEPMLRESPTLAAAYRQASFHRSVGAYVAVSGILPLLDRKDDFGSFSSVCRAWNTLARIARATAPARATDVRIAVGFGLSGDAAGGGSDGAADRADGEYTLFHRGVGPPMEVYCHNVLSRRPTEFVTLRRGGGTNFSLAPTGGSCRGADVRTEFSKLRIDPWTLTIKTDDYTFAKTEGGPLTQSYWNGARQVVLSNVPYATARDSLGGHYGDADLPVSRLEVDLTARGEWPLLPNQRSGMAMIDLRKTSFAVESPGEWCGDAFRSMGCMAGGRVVWDERNPGQLFHIAGGGYAGRVAPRKDRTLDETAAAYNYDDEGRNGGWVLPLKVISEEKKASQSDGLSPWLAMAPRPVM